MISKIMQKKLLAEKALSFDRAMEIALAVESATKRARDITSGMCDNVISKSNL